jgi:D-sedoheptulose 7-phosphate isomerase
MNEIADEINKTMQVVKSLHNDNFTNKIESIVNLCVDKITNNNKILLAGNGGSAGDAQHMAGELVSRFKFDRPAISALALTTDTSIMTAIGNDYGYEHIFTRQIEANGNTGDIFIAYSTSGNSKNILNALELANKKKIVTVGMTGNKKGRMNKLCDHIIEINSSETPKIQEGHLIVGHIICQLIESKLFK